jgi:RNA polymerase sigma-70 factor (ECF subfamily)
VGPEDQQLAGLFLKGVEGDAAAYREFLLRVRGVLHAYVSRQLLRMRLSEADADDIVQEALIAINNKRHTYDGVAPIVAWAVAIARYKLIDSLRIASRLEDIRSFEAIDTVVDEEDRAAALITVRRTLALLPDRFRIPIELMKIDGFSASEVAHRTGTSEVSVRVSVHRGLSKLAQLCGAAKRNHDEH